MATIVERRRLQAELYDNQMLPDICINIRMSITGAADPWPDAELIKAEEFLDLVLATWYPSIAKYVGFEEPIRSIVIATLGIMADYRRGVHDYRKPPEARL